MDLMTRQRNRDWLNDRLEEYPHRCHTSKTSLGPKTDERRLPGLPFIRCPVGRQIEWGFKREADMASFKACFVTVEYRG